MSIKEIRTETVRARKILLEFPPETSKNIVKGIAKMLGELFDCDVKITFLSDLKLIKKRKKLPDCRIVV